MKTYPMVIGGKAVNARKTFAVVNPALGEPFALVQEAGPRTRGRGGRSSACRFPELE